VKNNTLKTILDLKAMANASQPLPIKDSRAAWFAIGGKVTPITLSVPPREHHVETLTDLILLANRFKAEGASPVVWYMQDEVSIVIDDGGHRVETATLTLRDSEVFTSIELLAKNRSTRFDQKEFIRLLRVNLAGTLDPQILLNPIRKVDFATETVKSGTVMRGRESMGASVTSRIESASTPPETVTLMAPVYQTPGERQRYGVNCLVEVLPDEGKFQLIPEPDEIERVRQLALDSIEERLGDGLTSTPEGMIAIPFYQGRP
jgi:hypothetical protein